MNQICLRDHDRLQSQSKFSNELFVWKSTNQLGKGKNGGKSNQMKIIIKSILKNIDAVEIETNFAASAQVIDMMFSDSQMEITY